MLALTWCLPAALWAAPVVPLGLVVSPEGALTREGAPYRGIGVNYFDAFYRTLSDPKDASYEDGFRALAEHKVPFIRFMCSGFWPSDCKLYREDKEEYFRRLDAVVSAAAKHGIGLIPSLFWNMNTVPDLVGEPCDQWGNRDSKTHAFMREYVREVVTRYASSPAIWGWEFGNEYNLGADLPNAAEWRPPIWPNLGTATTRSARDDLTHDIIRTAFAAFAEEVRKHDPARIIETGSGFPRPSAWHQWKEHSWTQDSPEQFAEMLAGDNPDPIGVLSVHAYGEDERIKEAAAISLTLKKPLFVGEFGVKGPPDEKTQKEFADTLSVIEQSRVPLAALWVYDHGGQDEWNVTASNPRSYQLKAIGEANERIRATLKEGG